MAKADQTSSDQAPQDKVAAADVKNTTVEPAEVGPAEFMAWAQKVVFDFLDIVDIADVNKRRAAVIALKEDEESLKHRFNMAEGLIALQMEFAKAHNSVELMEHAAEYDIKAKNLAAWLGI